MEATEKIKKSFLIGCTFVIVFFSFSVAQARSIGKMLNIPEAYGVPHFEVDTNTSAIFYPFAKNKNNYLDSRFYVGFADWSIIGISYTYETFLSHIQLGLPLRNELNGSPYFPVISIGLENITAPKFFLPSNLEASSHHDNYSTYIVASKNLRYFSSKLPIQIHAGYGNGRFLGISQFSKKFSGIFMGVAWSPSSSWDITIEEDGKDLNMGINFNLNQFTVSLSCWEMEEIQNQNSIKGGFSIQYNFAPATEEGEIDPQQKEKIREKQKLISQKLQQINELDKQRLELENKLKSLEDRLDRIERTEP